MKDPNWRKCVLCADSRDVLKRIPDNSVDFILTDPPYNLAPHSTGNIPLPGRAAMNNDVAEWDLIEFNPEEWADEFVRILKPTGNLFIFTSYNQIGRWHKCLDHRFDTSNFMVWHKTNPAPKIFKAGFLNSCEMIFTCWNKKHTWNFISQKEMHNFVESPICMRPERLSNPKHPAQKPVAILKKMIEIATNTDDIVLDPFMGVGSMGVAALDLNRRFIGIEIEESYFNAAEKRIETSLDNYYSRNMKQEKIYNEECENNAMACDGALAYQTSLFGFEDFFGFPNSDKGQSEGQPTGLSPILKWPGGKEKELKYILPNLPKFERYFEPFVGGGSVFMGVGAREYYINDFSSELIDLYNCIATANKAFQRYVKAMDNAWHNAELFFRENKMLVDLYNQYASAQIDKDSLKKSIKLFCAHVKDRIDAILGAEYQQLPNILCKELETNLFRKMTRMRQLEVERHKLPQKDLDDNILTAIKSAIYMNFRHLYNCRDVTMHNMELRTALFFFIRNYAYSGMFRYSSKGDFNVPYGGIAYNSKLLAKKLDYYNSPQLQAHFSHARIFNLDFESFLTQTAPTQDDFVFLDPPYDSEFSTYAQNSFTRDDQARLAHYMINQCRAKWMMIIKNTDFIYNLYNHPGINIRTFDKEYMVSFMNRNDKKVTHLLITNY